MKDRIINENQKYNYQPFKIVSYQVENSYFNIQNKFNVLLKNYSSCKNLGENCNENEKIKIKELNGFVIFFRNNL